MADTLRNIEDLNLDEIDEDFLQDEAEELGIEKNVDTRLGSLYMDAAEGHIIRTAKFFDDLRQIRDIISLDTATGDVLTEYMHEWGLERNPVEATPARYYVEYVGALPEVGDLVSVDEHNFTVESVGEQIIIVSEETGSEMNELVSGTVVLPDIDIEGLVSCTLGEIAEPAQDEEDDDHARARLLSKLNGPAENGNISHVKVWCESVEGVGRARIIPLWNGPLTVKAVIITPDGRAPTNEVVENCQEYVDPGITGMGEGAANIGQFVTVVGAKEIPINVSVSVMKEKGTLLGDIKTQIEDYLEAFCKTIAMAESYSEDIQVRYNRISTVIMDIPSVIDIDNLTLNGGTSNIAFTVEEIPVLGEVTVDDNI